MSDPYRSSQSSPTIKANRPFRVFLSSGSTIRLTTARPWIDRLIARGFHVVDWTRFPDWDLGRPQNEVELIDAATKCEDAVVACDLFWYVVPNEKSEGAASELMLAKCHGKQIIGSGEFGPRNVFALRYIRPEMRFSDHETAFLAVCNIAEKSKTWRGEF